MTDAFFTDSWMEYGSKVLFRGTIPPNPNAFRVCLANSATLGRSSSLVDFVVAELLPSNGYSRASASFSGDGNYNLNNRRYENTISAVFSASSGAFQFQTVFLLADATATPSKSFTNTEVNPTADTITINNHGFSNGDKLIFTPDTLATLPGSINIGTIYAVANATANTFKIGVNITDTGSGTFRVRSANGVVVAYAIESAPITVPDGQSYSYQFPLAVLNTGYVNGI